MNTRLRPRPKSWPHDVEVHPTVGRPPQTVHHNSYKNHLDWLVCFTSITMLVLASSKITQNVTQIVVLLFLAPWGIVISRQPYSAFLSMVRNWFLLVLPLLALTSVLWSEHPDASFRGGLQYMATTIIGILIASCIKPRIAISALMSALGLTVVLSVLLAPGQDLGIFASKNYFALCIAIFILTSLAVMLDRSQPLFFRVIGFIALTLSPPVLVSAHSLGAVVDTIATLVMFFTIRTAIRLRPDHRFLIISVVLFFGTVIFILGIQLLEFSDLLQHFGKDTSLTGRTLLWQHALDSIWENPVAGLGYQAFWQVGNWSAEQLWLYSHIPSKYGFHFHDMYLQVAVDLGLIGLFLFVAIFIVLMARVAAVLMGPPPTAEQIFAMNIFIFFLLRSPIEVDLFFQFSIPSVLICMAWIYLPPIRFRRRTLSVLQQRHRYCLD
jgi:exopolysaccharide production protein ExoQ